MKRAFAKKVLASVFALVLSLSVAFAQVRVSGTVYDNNGEALAGAGVTEKGTTNGTMTDLNGKYTLTVKEGATLVFSFIGFQNQEVQVKKNTPPHRHHSR